MIGETVYARAYARALLGAAQDHHELESVMQDVQALERQWQGSPELRQFCFRHLPGAPSLRSKVVGQLWGDTFSRTILKLLELLAQWGHLQLIPLITERFQVFADRAQGCRNVVALFACEPQPGEVARVRQMVTDAYGPVFKLAVRVEPALLAGVRLRIDDRQVDASLAGRITRLKNGLLKPMRLDAAASEENRISL